MTIQTTETKSFNDYQEVLKALEPYINGARKGDGTLSRTAFFDHAHIVGSINGEFEISTADAFAEAVTSLGEAPNIQHQVAWIDISGPAAAAKIEFLDWKGFRFTDFFVLYKQDDEWKISGKTYDSHSQN